MSQILYLKSIALDCTLKNVFFIKIHDLLIIIKSYLLPICRLLVFKKVNMDVFITRDWIIRSLKETVYNLV